MTTNGEMFRLGYEHGRSEGEPYLDEALHPELQYWYEYGRLLAAEIAAVVGNAPPWHGAGPGNKPVAYWLARCPAYVEMRSNPERGLGFAFNHNAATLCPARTTAAGSPRRDALKAARLKEFTLHKLNKL